MRKYKLIVRCQLLTWRIVTDDDRKALNCYYETPVFFVNSDCEEIEIVDDAYEQFCTGKPELRHTESVELIRIT